MQSPYSTTIDYGSPDTLRDRLAIECHLSDVALAVWAHLEANGPSNLRALARALKAGKPNLRIACQRLADAGLVTYSQKDGATDNVRLRYSGSVIGADQAAA